MHTVRLLHPHVLLMVFGHRLASLERMTLEDCLAYHEHTPRSICVVLPELAGPGTLALCPYQSAHIKDRQQSCAVCCCERDIYTKQAVLYCKRSRHLIMRFS